MEQRFDERRSKIRIGNVIKSTSKMDEIVNKVAQSALEVFDLEDYFPDDYVVELDISQWLEEGVLLKESDFREQLKTVNWNAFEDKYVALNCKTDAILPAWTFALVTVHLSDFALKTIQGSKKDAIIVWYQDILNKLDYTNYFQKPVILKGCSKKKVPNEVYVLAIQKLQPIAKSIMFGEACSAVPLYKKKQS